MRAQYDIYPARAPAPLLDAATLLLVRSTPSQGWELPMTRRSAQASFVPGGYVFPGGGLEAQDAQEGLPVLARPDMPAAQRQAAIAAVRETFEEMGLLLAVHADGRPATQADVDALDRSASLWPQLLARGLQLDLRGVWLLAHWTAAPCVPKRFAVPFFIALAPQGQMAVADESEQFEPVWVAPQQALQQHADGHMPMIYPTVRTLERLAAYPETAALLAAVQTGPLWRSMPRSGRLGGKEYRCMENEAAYGELALLCPDGQAQHVLDWQSTQVVALRKNVLRLTAPNEGVMTGPGTNSYLIGEAATGFIAIDPGRSDAQHIERLLVAAGADIRAIVCTHSHPDHAPGRGCCRPCARRKPGSNPRCMACPAGREPRRTATSCPIKFCKIKSCLRLLVKAKTPK